MINSLFIIDDDLEDREFFSQAIRAIDPEIKIICAKDGEEAITFLSMSPIPDLILLDYNMPKMDGVQCLTKLKSEKRTKSIPVIMCGSNDDPNEVSFIKRLGAKDVIVKSSKQAEIRKKLKTIFRIIED